MNRLTKNLTFALLMFIISCTSMMTASWYSSRQDDPKLKKTVSYADNPQNQWAIFCDNKPLFPECLSEQS
jgi:hypothetical protein